MSSANCDAYMNELITIKNLCASNTTTSTSLQTALTNLTTIETNIDTDITNMLNPPTIMTDFYKLLLVTISRNDKRDLQANILNLIKIRRQNLTNIKTSYTDMKAYDIDTQAINTIYNTLNEPPMTNLTNIINLTTKP